MNNEHVSVPRDFAERISNILRDEGHSHSAYRLDAILSRATPSDERRTINEDEYVDIPSLEVTASDRITATNWPTPSEPRVVTDAINSVYAAAEVDDVALTVYPRSKRAYAMLRFLAQRIREASPPAARVPDGIADALLDAWRSIAHVSGSALLSGEKKAQTSEQRELVYGMACNALITIGNAYYELTGKNPDFAAAPQAGERG